MIGDVIGHENQSQHFPDGFPRRTDYHTTPAAQIDR